jgi:hypothetical protein
MRRDAIYPSIVVGKPPQEDAWLGKATERIFLPAIRATVPEIVDYDLPVAGAFHNCCIVSIEEVVSGHAQKVMHAIWGLGMLSLTKCVVVVDAHVNVHDYAEVLFYAGANVDPARDVTIGEGPLDHLDHAPQRQFVGGKLGIDATAEAPGGGARPWPKEIEMSPEILSLVTRRWSEYGIEVVSPARPPDSIRLPARCANCYDVDVLRGDGESNLDATGRGSLVDPAEDDQQHPSPTIGPAGFALGIVVLLVGLVVNPLWISTIGLGITVVFGFHLGREATRAARRPCCSRAGDARGRRRCACRRRRPRRLRRRLRRSASRAAGSSRHRRSASVP